MITLKSKISDYVKGLKGLNQARNSTESWIRDAKNSTGDKSIARTNEIFKPGKIYIFRYENPLDKERMWDLNPTVLSLGRVDGLDIGINLNYLNYNQRVNLLSTVYDQYSNIIEDTIERFGTNALNQKSIPAMNYDNISRFLEKSQYSKACRKYFTSKRKNTIVVGYNHWDKVAVINTSNFMNGDINKAQSK
jgi:hypothetical protein